MHIQHDNNLNNFAIDNTNIETVPSIGRHSKVIYNAYVYIRDRALTGGNVGYECEKHRGYRGHVNQCRARIHVRDGLIN